MKKPRVAIESPFAADTFDEVYENIQYARRCLLDSLYRGEAPFASHLLYTQVLNDSNPFERELGLVVGAIWDACVELHAVYLDRGISAGMQRAIDRAKSRGVRIEYRYLEKEEESR